MSKGKTIPAVQSYELHVFLATACSKDSVAAGCRAGEVHGLLIFCRQLEGEEAEERLARKSASAAGWKGIRIERSKRLPVTAEPHEEVLRGAFREALREGFSVLAHRRQEGRQPVRQAA